MSSNPGPSAFPAGRHLLCFGCGYTATRLAKRLIAAGGQASGTSRSEAGLERLRAAGINAWLFNEDTALPDAAFSGVTDVLCTIPPGADGDDGVMARHGETLTALPGLTWTALLSTTGVYGDTGGAWIDETAPLQPKTQRGEWRVASEERWLAWGAAAGRPVQVFRLPGIYGPDRSPFARLRAGTATRIIKPHQVFNRIHVDDIGSALMLAMQQPQAGPVFHLADDEPAAADVVTEYAATLLRVPPPPAVPIDSAELSPMALQFYGECKRLSNARVKAALGFELQYPTYREGLAATLAEETG